MLDEVRGPDRAARLEAAVARSRATDERYQVAAQRADQLLISILNEVQRRHLRDHGFFFVRGREHLYRIRKGRVANVDLVGPNGEVVDRFCAHPLIDCPLGDVMASQKLMLETDEAGFVRLANRHGQGGQPVALGLLQEARTM